MLKSRRPIRSTPAAEALAASDALNELIVLRTATKTILGTRIEPWALVDSKDSYNPPTMQHNSIDRSVRDDVNFTRLKFGTVPGVMG